MKLSRCLTFCSPKKAANTNTPKKIKQLCFCGPSGAGKSTLLKKLQAEFPDSFGFSVSHTTRKPRPGEKEGVDYFFTSMEEMKKEISAGNFIEHAEVHGNLYGTSVQAIKAVEKANRICILDIDIQGVLNVREKGAGFGLEPFYVFIRPPSLEILEERLRARKTETEESLAIRLKNAKNEMDKIHLFEHIIVNDNVDTAYSELRTLLLPYLQKSN
eukprot:c12414_g1_i1.p1 GENE.c12414_g1_i1~~c12414_g1_i1.p1  ORF type:complete len:232 (+),score=102.38 c12414_g1_i1:54-698(+)